jgi:multidrug efflux pump subunit AcrB
MIRAFVQNPRLIVLCVAVIIVAGLGAFSALPRMEDPHVTARTGIVITAFPGASAERVEALVTERLESKFRELTEVEHVLATSRAGISFIILDLKDEFTKSEVTVIMARARDLADEASASFPSGVGKTQIYSNRSHSFSLLLSLQGLNDESDLLSVGRYAKELESQLRSVVGTDRVQIFGAPKEEIIVSVDSHKLAAAGLSTESVSRALAAADTKFAAGLVTNNHQRFSVEVSGDLNNIERIRSVSLTVNQDGTGLRVGDVASVSRQELMPPSAKIFSEGERLVVVGTRMIASLRIDQWTQEVFAALDDFESVLPNNIKLTVLFNQNEYTNERLGDLFTNVLLGFSLIVGVLLITLGWRSALIVATALPLSILFTLFVMLWIGLPIHQMSVSGLIVALGIMVDNAIVMVDTINAEKRKGHSSVDAVQRAVRHLWLPLLGSTLTTILAFAPIAIMPGSSGEFISGIAYAVIISLVGSYIISHTLIAGLAGRFSEVSGSNQIIWWRDGIRTPRLSVKFERSLTWAMQHPKALIAMVMVMPMLGFIGVQQLPSQLYPASDRDMFHIEMFMPNSSSLYATEAMTKRVSSVLSSYSEIQKSVWYVGRGSPSFYYNVRSNSEGSPNFAQCVITTEHFSATNKLIPILQKQLNEEFPQAQILVRKLEQGPRFDAPIEFRLYGPNIDQLKILGNELRRIMSQTSGVSHSTSSLGSAIPQLSVQLNEEEANSIGLSPKNVSNQIQAALDGSVESSILESVERLPIRVRLAGEFRQNIDDLMALNIASPATIDKLELGRSGHSGVPLSAIASVNFKAGYGVITRRDGQRVNTVGGYVEDGLLPSTVVLRIKENMHQQNFTVPQGYRIEDGGEGEKRSQSLSGLMAFVGVLLVMMVVVVVLLFNSFRLSGIIFLVAVQASGLAMFSVYLFDFPFGFTSIIGLLGVIGLAINAAIVILAELQTDPAAVAGDELAIINGVKRCARHISSTTITTVGGFLPLILSGGGFWPPFAITIAGGTLLTTVISFFFVPVVFSLFAKRRQFEVHQ